MYEGTENSVKVQTAELSVRLLFIDIWAGIMVMKTKSHRNGSRYKRSSAPIRGHRNSIKSVLVWILSAVLLAGLLFFTVLLVWAFESRNMPALKIWHTTSLSGEFTADDVTPKSTLQFYLEK
jgi:uncharacterized BrkB/YihY/UPF0761 family membrane protein